MVWYWHSASSLGSAWVSEMEELPVEMVLRSDADNATPALSAGCQVPRHHWKRAIAGPPNADVGRPCAEVLFGQGFGDLVRQPFLRRGFVQLFHMVQLGIDLVHGIHHECYTLINTYDTYL